MSIGIEPFAFDAFWKKKKKKKKKNNQKKKRKNSNHQPDLTFSAMKYLSSLAANTK
jgi:hypothetical protein